MKRILFAALLAAGTQAHAIDVDLATFGYVSQQMRAARNDQGTPRATAAASTNSKAAHPADAHRHNVRHDVHYDIAAQARNTKAGTPAAAAQASK
jgi:hypothetical protein